jgi:hypothetical protein
MKLPPGAAFLQILLLQIQVGEVRIAVALLNYLAFSVLNFF